MIFFDMRTIIFSYVITDIVCLAVIVLLWLQMRRRFAGTGFFVFNFALQAIALFLIILRGQIPDWISMVLSNTMAMTGALLGYMGLLRFVGKKSSQIHNYALLTAFVFVHAYFALVQPNLAARNLNLSIVLLIICFQCAWLLLYSVESGMRRLTRGVGIVFCAYCLLSIGRIIEYFTGMHLASDYFKSGTFEQLVLISNKTLFILLTYSLVLMFNKRLLTDVKMGEEKFFKAFHSSPYAITITRMSDGQIIEVNESFFKITGYQLADVKGNTTIGMHLWNRAEDRAFVVSELASKGIVQEREFQFRKKSGELITGLFSAEIIKINNENCVLSNINNVSDRKRMEDVLKESERRLREVQEMAHLGFWKWDVKTGNVEWSEEVYKIFLLDPKEFTPHIDSILALSPWPEDNQRDKELINRAIKTHAPGFYEQKFLRTDKSIGYYSSTFQGNYDVKGELISIVGTVMDITERKREEEVLKESERQYRNLFENSMEGIFQTTPEGKLISANMAFAIMFGYESPEEIVRAVVDIGSQLYANPEERKKAIDVLSETGYIKDFECNMRRKDGTTFWTLINARFTENREGMRYFEGFIIDINTHKQAEQKIIQLNVELEKQVVVRTNDLRESQLALLNLVEDINNSSKIIASTNRTLEATNKEIEAFSYSVSHDLRAPLRSIDGFSQVLLEDYSKKLDATGRNYLERIRNATQHMGQLIDDMLKLSRVTRSEFRRESVDLSKMFREIAQRTQKNDPARIVDVTIQKGIIINGDSDLMHIVLTNLIENSWKFTGREVRPKIEFGTTNHGGRNTIFIRDNGVGFDMTYVDKLFGTFQRLHTKDEFIGTGIGLATVKRIITRHGGEVWAEGEVGKGAVFYFTIP